MLQPSSSKVSNTEFAFDCRTCQVDFAQFLKVKYEKPVSNTFLINNFINKYI